MGVIKGDTRSEDYSSCAWLAAGDRGGKGS